MPIKLSSLKPNPKNPRLIKDERFKKLVQSIREFPKMMELRPIIYDKKKIIIGGNMRYRALIELAYKEIPDEWTKKAEDLSDEERERFIIVDNIGYGENDWDMLANEWDPEKLSDWGLEMLSFKAAPGEEDDIGESIKSEFKIEVVCKDEKSQETTYNYLISKGYECRLLTL